MGQTGDPDQVRERLWLRVLNHLNNEICTELRDSETPEPAPVDILRLDSQHFRPVEQLDHLFVIQRNLRCDKRIVRIVLIVHGIGSDIVLQSTDHGRIVVSQDIQLQQVVVDGVIVKVGRDNAALHIIGRMLDRGELIDIVAVGKHDDTARMLSCTSPDPGTSHRDTLDLTAPFSLLVFFVVILHEPIGSLIRQSSDGSRLEGMSFAEKYLCIFMSLRLVISREVQVDIRLLISLKSEECLKWDIKTRLDQSLPAHRTLLIRHIIPASACECSDFIGFKIAVMAFLTIIMGA